MEHIVILIRCTLGNIPIMIVASKKDALEEIDKFRDEEYQAKHLEYYSKITEMDLSAMVGIDYACYGEDGKVQGVVPVLDLYS